MYFTSRINLVLTILFFILKYKFDFEIGFKFYCITILFGTIGRFLIDLIYDENKFKKSIEKNEVDIFHLQKSINKIEEKEKLSKNYIKSMKEFILE